MFFYNILIFSLLLFLSSSDTEASVRKVINTCGKISYDQPASVEDCKDEGEICCFVSIKDDTDTITKFCVSSPSDIIKGDVEKHIKDYTGFTVVELQCNKSRYISNFIAVIVFFSIICLL